MRPMSVAAFLAMSTVSFVWSAGSQVGGGKAEGQAKGKQPDPFAPYRLRRSDQGIEIKQISLRSGRKDLLRMMAAVKDDGS